MLFLDDAAGNFLFFFFCIRLSKENAFFAEAAASVVETQSHVDSTAGFASSLTDSSRPTTCALLMKNSERNSNASTWLKVESTKEKIEMAISDSIWSILVSEAAQELLSIPGLSLPNNKI